MMVLSCLKDNIVNWTCLGQYQPQHTATTSLLIYVTSAIDPNPTFTQSTYTATVDSQAAVVSITGTLFLSKEALSRKRVIFAKLWYASTRDCC